MKKSRNKLTAHLSCKTIEEILYYSDKDDKKAMLF